MRARAEGFAVEHIRLADKRLRLRRTFPALPGRDFGLCIHHAALLDILNSGIDPEKIHLGRHAVGVSTDAASVTFADGSSVSAPCVVVADGIHSALRQAVWPDIQVRHINQTIWRGIAEVETPDVMRNAFIEIWDEGLRFITVPMDARHTLWLAVKPEAPGGQDDPRTVRDELASVFAGYHPVVGDLIGGASEVLRRDMVDLGTPRRGWHAGRVVFLGDAIHATTPNLAQGGCQAIEDALCLALCLHSFGADLESAFSTYYERRSRKAAFVVRTSWTLGKAAHSRNPLRYYGYRAVLERAPDGFIRRQERYLNDLGYMRDLDALGLLRQAVPLPDRHVE